MASNAFNQWAQYLTNEDFGYLIEYIDNIKNGISNNKMIILIGNGRNGKTVLIREIQTYLGNELYEYRGGDLYQLIQEENIKPLIILQEGILDETNRQNKGNMHFVNSLTNFINYGISFIIETNHINNVNEKILEHSNIIMMNHQF